jgi:hypothetical protein
METIYSFGGRPIRIPHAPHAPWWHGVLWGAATMALLAGFVVLAVS